MSDFTAELRDFEDYYNSRVEGDSVIREAIHLRNVGWDSLRSGQREEGFVNLLRSYSGLSGEVTEFRRENYATAARIAQAYCADGQFDSAVDFAREALEVTPAGFQKIDARAGVNISMPDQYEAIFAGRLSLVLGTTVEGTELERLLFLSGRARFLAGMSEDPEKMSFTNRQMTPEERKATQDRFTKVAAWAGRASYFPLSAPGALSRISPAPLSRRDLAQMVCSK